MKGAAEERGKERKKIAIYRTDIATICPELGLKYKFKINNEALVSTVRT